MEMQPMDGHEPEEHENKLKGVILSIDNATEELRKLKSSVFKFNPEEIKSLQNSFDDFTEETMYITLGACGKPCDACNGTGRV